MEGEYKMQKCIYEDKFFQVISPDFPLNCRDDGGHLKLVKKKKVTDRSDMSYQEAIDFMRISMAVGKAMYLVAKEQTHQIRGQHMFLYPKDHKIYKGHLKPFTDDDLRLLKSKIEEILGEPKYVKMAQLAELLRCNV
jgi:hypothetical protein